MQCHSQGVWGVGHRSIGRQLRPIALYEALLTSKLLVLDMASVESFKLCCANMSAILRMYIKCWII